MPEINKDLICKDCVHSFVPFKDLPNYWINGHYWLRCKNTAEMDESKFSVVVGYRDKKPIYQRCCNERDGLTYTKCGPDAKFWSPKKKKDLFKLLARD